MELSQLPNHPVKEVGVVDHQGNAIPLGEGHQLSGFLHASAHRLFDKDMLAAEERTAREGEMSGSGGGDCHRVYLRIVDEFARVFVHPDSRSGSASRFPGTLPSIGHGQHIEPRIARKRPEQVLTPIAVTTEPDFDDAHSASVMSWRILRPRELALG